MADTIRAEFLKGYADLARDVGLDPLRMLDAAGIPRAALDDPDLRVSVRAGRDLLEQSARAAEDFGLRMSERRSPSVMGPVALIFREQPTLRDAIHALVRFSELHAGSNSHRVEEDGEVAILHLILNYPGKGSHRQGAELSMGQIVQMYQRFLGRTWRPLSVHFIHGKPSSPVTHHRVLGPNVLFDQAFNGLVCSRSDFDTPNPAADPEMARQIGKFVEGLMEGAAERTLAGQVREHVRALLPLGYATAERVAAAMSMDVRTMQRRLGAEGTGFIDAVHEVRADFAGQYLEESDRPLAEVAELLGFSALSAFSRWHKTQFGASPSARREAARGG